MPNYRRLGHTLQMQLWLPQVLVGLLIFPPTAAAQAPASPPQTAPVIPPTAVQSLRVIPLAGNQEMNDLERKVMAPLVVQVVDQNYQPVEGASVVFRFPLEGPSASFPGEKNAQTYRTNADGQAAATGWAANGKVGTFQVQVTASRDNELGSVTISMTNVTRIVDTGKIARKHWYSSKWTKIGIAVVAAGIVTAIVLVNRSSSSHSTPVITATPGSPTIGGPQ